MADVYAQNSVAMTRKIILFLISTILCLLGLEAALRRFDPVGISYFEDNNVMLAHLWYEGDLYMLVPTTYHLKNFSMTIREDYSRAVPDTPESAACTIVAIGDSVTMGHGVEDNETWVNLLALEFPDVRFINTGLNGYNSQLVMLMQERWLDQADGFIYYVNRNDVYDLDYRMSEVKPYLSAYIRYFLYASLMEGGTRRELEFWQELAAIQATASTLFFVDDPALAMKMQTRLSGGVYPIRKYTSSNSGIDVHADPAGNFQIFTEMKLSVGAAIQRWCK